MTIRLFTVLGALLGGQVQAEVQPLDLSLVDLLILVRKLSVSGLIPESGASSTVALPLERVLFCRKRAAARRRQRTLPIPVHQ